MNVFNLSLDIIPNFVRKSSTSMDNIFSVSMVCNNVDVASNFLSDMHIAATREPMDEPTYVCTSDIILLFFNTFSAPNIYAPLGPPPDNDTISYIYNSSRIIIHEISELLVSRVGQKGNLVIPYVEFDLRPQRAYSGVIIFFAR